jgi:thiol:disulfide interchange protein
VKKFILLSLLLGLWLPARFGIAGTAPPIHFTATAAPTPAHPGEVATVTVQATVDPGWHVYSVVPTPNGPAATAITSLGNWTPAGPTTEDMPQRKMDPNFGAVVGYHENTATFSRQFRVGSSTAQQIVLHYQTCNDKICLPPTDVTLPVSVTVMPGPVRPQYAQVQAGPAPTLSKTPQGGDLGLGLFLLAALGAGFLALLTPCVFPLIPITLTSFVKQAAGDKGKLVRLSSGYAAGVVALYVALGATVTLTLGANGLNRVAANPWVNLGLFALFVVFALSFFETIQLHLPGNLGALQSTARSQGGLAGLALLGVTFVLASFTCTAPFLGTLLVAAAAGSRFRPLLGMLTFALAFVSPFLVFSLFPQWIGRIPKGGVWMARFKATLGFLELAAALKFLSNADQVWQWKLLTPPVLLAAWAVIFVCAGLYLLGPLRFGIVAETEPTGTRLPPVRAALGTLFVVAALYCFWGLSGRPLSPYVGAFLPPPGYGGTALRSDTGLPWLTDYSTALAQAQATGKPLLIDFTGYTCTNCRLNERLVFPKPSVQQQFADYVRVQLYTDGGKNGPQNQALEQSKFGDVALPLYGIVDPKTGSVVAQTAGVQSINGFTQFLKNAQTVAATSPPPLPISSAAWAAYSPSAVAQASVQGKPVIVDLTAAWCVNCKAIEHDVFQNPTVASTLGSQFVTLRADLTQWGSPSSAALEKQYGVASLPTVLFLDRSGHEIKTLRITGRLSVADFQRRMQQASQPQSSTVAALP